MSNAQTPTGLNEAIQNIDPQSLWIGITNCKKDGLLHVVIEVNGVEKIIWSMKPSYADPEEGLVNQFTSLTWILENCKKRAKL